MSTPGICVCVLAIEPTPFRDNVVCTCCDCGVAIQHRPHAPAELLKVCMRCSLDRLNEQVRAGVPITVAATAETRREVIEHFRNRRH